MKSPTLTLLNNLTDEDFIAIHKSGQLKSLCQALTIDLQSHTKDTKDKIDC